MYFNKLSQKVITALFSRTQEILTKTNWKAIATQIHSNSKGRTPLEFFSVRTNLDAYSNMGFPKNHVALLKYIYTSHRNCYQDVPKLQGDKAVYACSTHEVLFVLPRVFIGVYI